MRKPLHTRAERGRIVLGQMGSRTEDGPNGFFMLEYHGVKLNVMASDGMMWEHVSVSVSGLSRLPTWDEMCFIKSLFWRDDEAVMQLHPPVHLYVDNAPVLHLWKPIGMPIPLPHPKLVGLPGVKMADEKGELPKKRRRHGKRK